MWEGGVIMHHEEHRQGQREFSLFRTKSIFEEKKRSFNFLNHRPPRARRPSTDVAIASGSRKNGRGSGCTVARCPVCREM